MAINFISCKDSNGVRIRHSKSGTIEIMIGYETDEIIEKLFDSFLQKYQKCLKESMKGSKNHKKHVNKGLIKRFANTYDFCNGDIKKFCLMLRKSVYPYEYIDFYSNLNMEDTTDADYTHAKKKL